ASRELFETAFGFAFLLLRLLLLRALHGLVLVLHLVELELEQTGQFLLFSLTATTTTRTALIAEGNLHLAEDRIRSEQPLQRALLWRQRVFALFFSQRRRRAFHLFGRLLQVLGHLRHLFLTVDTAESTAHPIEKLERVSPQFFLTDSNGVVTIFAFLVRVLVAFANQPVRRRNQIFLTSRQRVLILVSLTTTAAALLLRLLVLHLERFDFDKVDVAGCFITRVTRLRKVRDEISGFEIVFLEEERVGAGERARRLARQLLEIDFLFFAAVDGEVQVHRHYAVVVFCTCLREHFFEVRRLSVASGFVERDHRRLIGEH